MAPFGILYTKSNPLHPRSRKACYSTALPTIVAVAKLGGLELTIPDFKVGIDNRSPEYLAKFPLGKTPAFESPSGFTLDESNAIAHYLAESGPKKAQFLGSSTETTAQIQHWIFWNELQFEPDVWRVGAWRLGLVPYDEKEDAAGMVGVAKGLDYLEARLKGRKWIVEQEGTDGPTLADITLAGPIVLGIVTYLDQEIRARYPETFRWYKQLVAIEELAELYDRPMVENRRPAPAAPN